ncbi:MAG: plasmid recombination protein [Lachnospiraceae bacterium]|nr:plasmid recombination protein [Lachnospiraceae bacterium]
MAHVKGFTKFGLTNIFAEHDRTAQNYKNNVDLNRSYLNFDYGVDGRSASSCNKAVMNRTKEIMNGEKIQNQTNVMCEWKVTYPSELCFVKKCDSGEKDKKGKPVMWDYNVPYSNELCEHFFREIYQFTSDRYGKDNMIGGYVHMDETTPHIHIAFVPEAVSRKTGRRTVSTASLITKKELSSYQKDLANHMISVFGQEAKYWILNGRTQTGETIEQMKARRAADEKLAERSRELDEKEERIRLLEEELERERLEHEDKLRELKQRIVRQKDINNIVDKGTSVNLSKYQNIARFLD